MDDLVIAGVSLPDSELEELFETSGGPGGQHANRNETSVRLRLVVATSSLPEEMKNRIRHNIGEMVEVVASDSRSQFRNRALARQRLREKVEEALREPPDRKPTKPTKASRQRRLEDKRARSETKKLRQPPPSER